MQKRFAGLANKIAKRPSQAVNKIPSKSGKSYGTFSKNVKEFTPAFNKSESVPAIEKVCFSYHKKSQLFKLLLSN